jgi:hypothetical protein
MSCSGSKWSSRPFDTVLCLHQEQNNLKNVFKWLVDLAYIGPVLVPPVIHLCVGYTCGSSSDPSVCWIHVWFLQWTFAVLVIVPVMVTDCQLLGVSRKCPGGILINNNLFNPRRTRRTLRSRPGVTTRSACWL